MERWNWVKVCDWEENFFNEEHEKNQHGKMYEKNRI